MSPPRSERPRRGLVLGAGGVLGASWTIGALRALEETLGVEPRNVDALIGTSAGSVLASLVAGGISTATLLSHQRGIVTPGDPRLQYDYDSGSGGALPPLPIPSLGSGRLLLHAARHPRSRPPLTVLSAVLPRGRGSLEGLRPMIEAVARRGQWSTHPSLWIVAMDYATGSRVAFGRPGSPPAGLSDAVLASCSIPGWYAPVTIGGRRYIDGGTCSSTSADLLSGQGLDEVYVLAPMVSLTMDEPRSVAARVERRLRGLVTRRLLREVGKLRAAGTMVTVLGPGPEDLRAIGANLMDPRRRMRVLETSLRTSAAALAEGTGGSLRSAS